MNTVGKLGRGLPRIQSGETLSDWASSASEAEPDARVTPEGPALPLSQETRHRSFAPPSRRVVTRESSLSSTCLYPVDEVEENGADLSTHGAPGPRDCVSGLLPFDQYEVDILVDDEALVVDFSTVKTTSTAQLHAATLFDKPVTSKRLLDKLAGNPTSLECTALLLEAKALTALNRDQGHPAVPVIHGVSMRQTWSPVVVLEALYGPTLAEFFASVRTPIKHVAKKKNSGNGRNKAMGGSTVTGGVWTSTPGASSCCQLSCTCMLMAWCIPTSAATQLCSQRVSSPSIGYGFKDKGDDRASFVWV